MKATEMQKATGMQKAAGPVVHIQMWWNLAAAGRSPGH